MAFFVLLLEENRFLAEGFPFLDMSFSVRFRFVAAWNIHAITFLSYFCFLDIIVLLIFVLFLISLISLSLFFFYMVALSTLSLILESFPSFFSWHIQAMLFLGCMALCIVISFLVIWSICWSSFLLTFKNSPEPITSRAVKVFILLMRFDL